MNIQEEKQVTIHINGCNVTVPASQEQIYREALADKRIDGCRVYVENGNVKTQFSNDIDNTGYMDIETSRLLLLECNKKRFALHGKL